MALKKVMSICNEPIIHTIPLKWLGYIHCTFFRKAYTGWFPVITHTRPGLRKPTNRFIIFMQWRTITVELVDLKSSGSKVDMVLNDSSSGSCE